MDTRSRYVFIVLASAVVVAIESVAVEGAIKTAHIDSFVVSAVPTVAGGLMLMAVFGRKSVRFVKGLDVRGWSYMFVLCALVATGVFLWFDAVGRIGASKEAILGGGSSEVLFIALLSVLFLRERMNLWEVSGSVLVLMGVFLVLANGDSISPEMGLGEVEAILSSLLLGASVVATAVLLKTHALGPLSGLELFLSGVLLLAFGVPAGLVSLPSATGMAILVLIGVLPCIGLLAYNSGLPKIGAPLTAVLFALNGVMTMGVQLLVLAVFPDASFQLPDSIAFALAGGGVAFAGVYLLTHRPSVRAR